MEKEIFIKAIAEQEQIINDAQKLIGVLRHQYLMSNEHLSLNQKVTIVTKEHKSYSFKLRSDIIVPQSERFVFVNRINLNNYDGEFSYGFYKCKKDGTESQIKDYLSGTEYIKELATTSVSDMSSSDLSTIDTFQNKNRGFKEDERERFRNY